MDDAALLGNEQSFDHDVITAAEGSGVCFFLVVSRYVFSGESAENKQCRAGPSQPRHGPPAARIKVGRFHDDGRRRFDVRAQVSDAVGSAAAHQGS